MSEKVKSFMKGKMPKKGGSVDLSKIRAAVQAGKSEKPESAAKSFMEKKRAK